MIKQFIGIILILVIITAYVLWWRFNKNQAGVTAKKGNIAEFDITVKGVYSPAVIKAKKGQRVKINFTRRENAECSRFVIFDDFKIRKELPENQTITIEITPEKTGEYDFTCDMGMYQGRLIVY